ncbi:putative lipoprotein [Bordetella pertussis]|nr:putative lipoprotein [Bordetella pertussis]
MVSRRVLLQAAAAAACMGWKPAFSASWPARSVRLVSPTSVGTTTDTVARFVADGLSKRLKAAFMVEPRPGAGGIIASSEVARSRADGYTVLFGAIGHYLAQYLTDNPPVYDPVKDFAPIARVGFASVAIVVRSDSPYKTLADLIEAMRAQPKRITFSSFGLGSAGHLCGVLLNDATGTRGMHVAYKGTGAAVIDVASGLIDFTRQSAASVLPLIDSGQLRALAVASRSRWPQLPDVPTAIEAGVPDFVAGSWMGALVRADTPPDIVQRLSDAMVGIARSPEFTALCAKQMIDVEIVDHAQWAADADNENARWQRVAALVKQG